MLKRNTEWPENFANYYREIGLWEDQTLGKKLSDWASKYSSKIAVIDKNKEFTYSDINLNSKRLAAGFKRLGIKPGNHVIIHLPNIAEFIIVCFALFRLGALPIFALPAHRRNEIVYLCKFSKAVAYIIPDKHQGFDFLKLASEVIQHVPNLEHVIVVGQTEKFTSLEDLYTLPEELYEPNPNEVAFYLLSGGTTGFPKLIPRTHNDYCYNLKATSYVACLNQESIYLASLPIAHNFALGCPGIFGTLSMGGKVILIDNPSPDEAFPIIERERVTITGLVPTLALLWMDALDSFNNDLSSIKLIQVGGAKFKSEHAALFQKKFKAKLQQSFGMSEGFLSQTRITDSETVITFTQGSPISPADELLILDDLDNPLPIDTIGNLLVRGPYTIRGYYNAESHNQHAFTKDGYFRTGDLARITPAGHLIIEGRINDVINRGGEKVPAEEVESHLLAYPDIIDAAVIAMPDAILGERTCAYVILKKMPLKLYDINNFLRERGLADYKLLDRLEILSNFPKTNVGKVNKVALRKKIAEKLEKNSKD